MLTFFPDLSVVLMHSASLMPQAVTPLILTSQAKQEELHSKWQGWDSLSSDPRLRSQISLSYTRHITHLDPWMTAADFLFCVRPQTVLKRPKERLCCPHHLSPVPCPCCHVPMISRTKEQPAFSCNIQCPSAGFGDRVCSTSISRLRKDG